MIQDIAPHTFHNEYQPKMPKPSDYLIIIDDRKILLKDNSSDLSPDGAADNGNAENSSGGNSSGENSAKGNPAGADLVRSLPNISELEQILDICPQDSIKVRKNLLTYLFSIDDKSFFFLPGTPKAAAPFEYVSEMALRELEGDYLSYGAATAVQLAQWYTLHQFCGRCGVKTIHSKDERAIICPKCGHIYYPRISPVVIIAITHEDKILLTMYNRRGAKRHALVAGFVEIGETLEDAVRREIMEEVGLKVRDIRYIESQPWAFSSSLISGFRAEVEGDPTVHLNTDGKDELASAEWFSRDQLTVEDHSVSLTWDMIRKFKEGKL